MLIELRRKLGALTEQLEQIATKMTAIVASAEAADEGKGRALTEAEASELAAKRSEYTALSQREAQLRETIRLGEEAEGKKLAMATVVRTGAGASSGSALLTTHDNAEDRPWAADPRRAFAEIMQAVHKAEPRVSGVVDPRLRPMAVSGSNETIGSEGGFLLQPTVVGLIDKLAFDSAQLAQRCFPVEVGSSSNSAEIDVIEETSRATGSRFGGVQVYHAAEGATVTASKPKVRKVSVKLEKIFGLWYVSDEQLEDSDLMASIGPTAFAEELAFQVDEDIFAGTGAGQCLGIIKSSALVSVAKESGQDAATIDEANVRKMLARMPSRSRQRAIWLVHADAETALQGMALPCGQPVYLPPGGYSEAPYARLFNIPVIVNEHSKALGSKGDIVLADFGWYALVRKGGTRIAESIHVKFIYDEMTYRFTTRVNGLPLLSSAITPAQGSNQISPFVTLDERA